MERKNCPPDIKIYNLGSQRRRLKGNVEVFYPELKLSELLDVYINTDITEYLPNSSVKGVKNIGGAPESNDGQSRILTGFKMKKNLPDIFEVNLQQTVWDYKNGKGRILVSILSGFLDGFVDVCLKDIEQNGKMGVYAEWNLDNVSVKTCQMAYNMAEIMDKMISFFPIFRNVFSNISVKILNVAGLIPKTLIASIVVFYAIKIPPKLTDLVLAKNLTQNRP